MNHGNHNGMLALTLPKLLFLLVAMVMFALPGSVEGQQPTDCNSGPLKEGDTCNLNENGDKGRCVQNPRVSMDNVIGPFVGEFGNLSCQPPDVLLDDSGGEDNLWDDLSCPDSTTAEGDYCRLPNKQVSDNDNLDATAEEGKPYAPDKGTENNFNGICKRSPAENEANGNKFYCENDPENDPGIQTLCENNQDGHCVTSDNRRGACQFDRNNDVWQCTPLQEEISCDPNTCSGFCDDNGECIESCNPNKCNNCREGQSCGIKNGQCQCTNEYTDPKASEKGEGPGPIAENPQKISFKNPIAADSIPQLVVTLVRGLLGLLGTAALLIIIYAGVKYMTEFENPADAKKNIRIITNAVVGLVIIMGSFLIVQYLISAVVG